MLEPAYNKNTRTRKPETNGADAAEHSENPATAVVSATEDAPRFVAPTHGGVDILKLLTELEDLIENTPKKMGMMFRFDEDKFHMTVMKIRANLPEEMKRASKLARDSERIVEESREHADHIVEEARKTALSEFERGKAEIAKTREMIENERRKIREAAERESQQALEEARTAAGQILEEAKAQAAQLVAEDAIAQQAKLEAQALCQNAAQEAQGVRRGADDYARDVLGNLENVLGKAVSQVQRGREMLEQR